MNDILNRVVLVARRLLNLRIHYVLRDEWESKGRDGGKPTKLSAPLTPFAGVDRDAPVVTYAMSSMPYANPGGFHIVRRDPADAPKIFNTDSYDEINLASDPRWRDIVSGARLKEPEIDWLLSKYVFLVGPKRREDHHSLEVPPDISGAKPK